MYTDVRHGMHFEGMLPLQLCWQLLLLTSLLLLLSPRRFLAQVQSDRDIRLLYQGSPLRPDVRPAIPRRTVGSGDMSRLMKDLPQDDGTAWAQLTGCVFVGVPLHWNIPASRTPGSSRHGILH